MIPIFNAIRLHLLTSPAVGSLVGAEQDDDNWQGRIDADVLEQDGTLPALVLQSWFIRDVPTSTGSSGFEQHRLQVDAYAETRSGADEFIDAVAQALDPRAPNAREHVRAGVRFSTRQDTGAGRPTYDGLDTKLFRRSLDFKVQAARAA
jgi:hypothetical protein